MISRIHSGGAFEPKIGYCRAVVAGGWIHVAGTVGPGDSVTEQCK
ncbi:RidA family protein, partial [Synechococcus sp. MU1644]|nr:RidA family protein [Synechococcus sp. MU1644]